MAKVTMEEIKYGPISDKKFTYAKNMIELMGLLGYTIKSLDYAITKTQKNNMPHVADKCFAMFKSSKFTKECVSNKLLKEFKVNNVLTSNSALYEKQEFVGCDLFLRSAFSRDLTLVNTIYPILQSKKEEYKSSPTTVSAIQELENNLFTLTNGSVVANECELDNSVQNFMVKVCSNPESDLYFDSNLHCVKESILECDKEYAEENNKTKDLFENSNKEDINYYYNNEYSTLTELNMINEIENDYIKTNLQAAKNIQMQMGK